MTSTRQQRWRPNVQIYRHSHREFKRKLLPYTTTDGEYKSVPWVRIHLYWLL